MRRKSLCCGVGKYSEFQLLDVSDCTTLSRHGLYSIACDGSVSHDVSAQMPQQCLTCRKVRRILMARLLRFKNKTRYPLVLTAGRRLKCAVRTLRRRNRKILSLHEVVRKLREMNSSIKKAGFEAKIKQLPKKQQCAVRACFEASRRRSLRGYHYEKAWLLECMILRMKSPRLYEHLRAHKILVLPSRVCLQKYSKAFKASYGFSHKLLECVKEKASEMDEMNRHGGLLIDEMKLSAHLDLKSTTDIEGFVNLGQFTGAQDKHTKADHGLVVMFQLFVGKWTQVIGVFASNGNVKAPTLTKIILEAALLCEQASLHVDYICTDGASWNRAMWHNMGVYGNAKHVRCKVPHPCDKQRFLHFFSDFPHLVKCVRNTMMSHGFSTHKGRAHWEHVAMTWKVDSSAFILKVAPKLTRSHIYPSGFEKIRVNLAFSIFNSAVVHAMDLYKEKIEQEYPNLEPTRVFIEMMAQAIEAMTSRRGSAKETALDSMLSFLDEWEAHARGLGFLSKNTSEGLRVSIHSTKDLLKYLTEKVGFRFLMTSRLSQDCLERSFGIVRQASGANDHPTPAQFIIIMKCISFYSLAKGPKGGNVSPGLLESLLSEEQLLQENREAALDDIALPAEAAEVAVDHADYVEQHSDARLVYYIAGYVARKRILLTGCEACRHACLVTREGVPENLPAEVCKQWDMGGLLYPSESLYKLIQTLEDRLTRAFSTTSLHAKVVKKFLSLAANVPLIGCREHSTTLTGSVARFYCIRRVHFLLKGLNQPEIPQNVKRVKPSVL